MSEWREAILWSDLDLGESTHEGGSNFIYTWIILYSLIDIIQYIEIFFLLRRVLTNWLFNYVNIVFFSAMEEEVGW